MLHRNHSNEFPGRSEVPAGNNYAETTSDTTTTDDLMDELKQPRREAVDTNPTLVPDPAAPVTDPPASAGGFSFLPPPDPEAEPEPEPEPIFPGDPAVMKDTGLIEDDFITPERKLNKGQSERKLKALLKARDIIQARILAKVALVKDKSHFKMTEDEFQILAEAYLPYMEEHGGKIPVWIDIVIAEAIVMGDKIADAMNVRKTNLENERLKGENKELKGKLMETVTIPLKGQRKNWKIDRNGYYEKDTFGDYIKKGDRKEKASLKDIGELAFYNSAEIIKEVFGLSDEEIAAYSSNGE